MKRLAIVLILAFSPSVDAAEWNQWRGPNHDGVSTETGIMASWPQSGPKLLWRAENLGAGYSNLSFAGNRIYSMGDREDGCYLYALDISSGKELWHLKVGNAGGSRGNTFTGSRCTPATDGLLVFAIGQFGDFVCADAKSGKEYWRVNVTQQYSGFVTNSVRSGINWDFSMSPILDATKVVLPIGGQDGTVICFDNSNKGPNILWRSKEITDGAAYTSIVPVNIGGKHQYLLLTMEHLAGLDPENGAVLWKTEYPGVTAVCSDPVSLMDGENICYIMCASAYNVGGHGYKITFDSGKFGVEKTWSERRYQSHHGGLVRIGEHFYMLTDRELTCIDPKTGESVWRHRSVGKGSIFAVDGKLIVRSEAGEGTVALVEATPDAYKEVSRFNQPDRSGKQSWTYPLVYGGKLYLRDQGLLLCYELKQ